MIERAVRECLVKTNAAAAIGSLVVVDNQSVLFTILFYVLFNSYIFYPACKYSFPTKLIHSIQA